MSSTRSSGQARTLSFTSNSQLALALTASRDNQLASSSTARGSQAGDSAGVASGARVAAALNSTAGVGGEPTRHDEAVVKEDPAAFWRWLQSDEGLMDLWLNGIDPSVLMQMGVHAEPQEPQP